MLLRGLWSKTRWGIKRELPKHWTEAWVASSRAAVSKDLAGRGAFLVLSRSWNKDSRSVLPGLQRKEPNCFAKFIFPWTFRNQGLEMSIWKENWRGTQFTANEVANSQTLSQSVMVRGAMSSEGVCPLSFLTLNANSAFYKEIVEHFMLLYGDAALKRGKRKMRDTGLINADEPKAAITSAVRPTDLPSTQQRIDAFIHLKGAPTK